MATNTTNYAQIDGLFVNQLGVKDDTFIGRLGTPRVIANTEFSVGIDYSLTGSSEKYSQAQEGSFKGTSNHTAYAGGKNTITYRRDKITLTQTVLDAYTNVDYASTAANNEMLSTASNFPLARALESQLTPTMDAFIKAMNGDFINSEYVAYNPADASIVTETRGLIEAANLYDGGTIEAAPVIGSQTAEAMFALIRGVINSLNKEGAFESATLAYPNPITGEKMFTSARVEALMNDETLFFLEDLFANTDTLWTITRRTNEAGRMISSLVTSAGTIDFITDTKVPVGTMVLGKFNSMQPTFLAFNSSDASQGSEAGKSGVLFRMIEEKSIAEGVSIQVMSKYGLDYGRINHIGVITNIGPVPVSKSSAKVEDKKEVK